MKLLRRIVWSTVLFFLGLATALACLTLTILAYFSVVGSNAYFLGVGLGITSVALAISARTTQIYEGTDSRYGA